MKMTFEAFLQTIDPFTEGFVSPVHKAMTEKGYTVDIKPAAQGPVVSYLTPKAKRTVFNYVFRKSGMQVRIYGDNAHQYLDFLQTLPDVMKKVMDKAGICRQCNARCPKGYPVPHNGIVGIKCRYGAYLFPLNPESAPFIQTFIGHEISEREKKA